MTPRTSAAALARSPLRLLLLGALLLTFAAAAPAEDEEAATTTGSNTIAVTGTALPAIVTETEDCALLCYQAALVDAGCLSAGDFACVCGNPQSLVVKMGICVGNDCDDHAQFDSGAWMADMCAAYSRRPGSAVVASASAVLVSEVAAAAATATDNPLPSTASIDNAVSTEATGTGAAATATPSSAAGALPLPVVLAGVFGGAVVAAGAML